MRTAADPFHVSPDLRSGLVRQVAAGFGRDPAHLERALEAADAGDPAALKEYGLAELPPPVPGRRRSDVALELLTGYRLAVQVMREAAELGVSPEAHMLAVVERDMRQLLRETMTEAQAAQFVRAAFSAAGVQHARGRRRKVPRGAA